MIPQLAIILLAGPTAQERSDGLVSALTGTTTVTSLTLAGGRATIEVGDRSNAVVRSDEVLAFGQIVCTMTSRLEIGTVAFTSAGTPLGVPRADGALTTAPLTVSVIASWPAELPGPGHHHPKAMNLAAVVLTFAVGAAATRRQRDVSEATTGRRTWSAGAGRRPRGGRRSAPCPPRPISSPRQQCCNPVRFDVQHTGEVELQLCRAVRRTDLPQLLAKARHVTEADNAAGDHHDNARRHDRHREGKGGHGFLPYELGPVCERLGEWWGADARTGTSAPRISDATGDPRGGPEERVGKPRTTCRTRQPPSPSGMAVTLQLHDVRMTAAAGVACQLVSG